MRPAIFHGFAAELAAISKMAEYAPGIPDKHVVDELPAIIKPVKFEVAVHDHHAKKRGRHFDLRLGDRETGIAHSWALHPRLPGPGESVWAVRQPSHTVRYMDFEGEIPSGYGAGKVALALRDQAEVTSSSKNHIHFNLYPPSGPQEYALHQLGEKEWKLFNVTPTAEKLKIQFGKPKYKEVRPEKMDVSDDRYLMSAKIDDAHNLFVLPGSDERVRVVSYRPRKQRHDRGSDLIEHTHKLPELGDARTPAGLGGTILRGGVYALHPKTGEATDAHLLGGLLNSDVWKSREKQQEHGALRAVLYDVEKYRGRDVSKSPYDQKLAILREVCRAIPGFELPPLARNQTEKLALWNKIKSGKLPETKEGVVLWRRDQWEPPTKVKLKRSHDVFVRDFFPGEGKFEGVGVGGFSFSHSPDGEVVGRVGTGLSDALRRDMHQHPERYLGSVAVLESMSKFDSGALRAPAFKSWHLDKNEPSTLARMVSR